MKNANQAIIIPPQCLGIMGGGQLGRMFAIAAKQMGYKVAVLDPDSNCPAQHFADFFINTAYTDQAGLDQLAQIAAVISTEFENVPAESLKYLQQFVAVYPDAQAVSITQNRILEKQFFNANNVATTAYYAISTLDDISSINLNVFPAILKTTTQGYDGKGQMPVANPTELTHAFKALAHAPYILEKLVDLKLEVSVIVARNAKGTIAYPVVENIHKNGILELTIAPARIEPQLTDKVTQMALHIINKLDYIGILAIEFFITHDGQILANEMAPRPHNSGHYTIDACATSQFEQQIRAICNLQLGQTTTHEHAIMLGLLGDIWPSNCTQPAWDKILTKYANLKLHLYEKLEARPGRKMGHITVTGNDIEQLYTQINEIKRSLGMLAHD